MENIEKGKGDTSSTSSIDNIYSYSLIDAPDPIFTSEVFEIIIKYFEFHQNLSVHQDEESHSCGFEISEPNFNFSKEKEHQFEEIKEENYIEEIFMNPKPDYQDPLQNEDDINSPFSCNNLFWEKKTPENSTLTNEDSIVSAQSDDESDMVNNSSYTSSTNYSIDEDDLELVNLC